MYTAGTLSLLDSTVSGNHAGAGGGVYSLGTASVIGATLSGNSATYGGGFVHSGTSTITNTTFGANIAPVGGGLQVNSFGATLTNVTFQANSNGIWTGYAQVTLRNTVLAGSTSGPNCSGYPEAGIVSQGFNLSSDNSCAYLTQPGDRTGVNPLLGPLANNGGPTLTHLPAATSPGRRRWHAGWRAGARSARPAAAERSGHGHRRGGAPTRRRPADHRAGADRLARVGRGRQSGHVPLLAQSARTARHRFPARGGRRSRRRAGRRSDRQRRATLLDRGANGQLLRSHARHARRRHQCAVERSPDSCQRAGRTVGPRSLRRRRQPAMAWRCRGGTRSREARRPGRRST